MILKQCKCGDSFGSGGAPRRGTGPHLRARDASNGNQGNTNAGENYSSGGARREDVYRYCNKPGHCAWTTANVSHAGQNDYNIHSAVAQLDWAYLVKHAVGPDMPTKDRSCRMID